MEPDTQAVSSDLEKALKALEGEKAPEAKVEKADEKKDEKKDDKAESRKDDGKDDKKDEGDEKDNPFMKKMEKSIEAMLEKAMKAGIQTGHDLARSEMSKSFEAIEKGLGVLSSMGERLETISRYQVASTAILTDFKEVTKSVQATSAATLKEVVDIGNAPAGRKSASSEELQKGLEVGGKEKVEIDLSKLEDLSKALDDDTSLEVKLAARRGDLTELKALLTTSQLRQLLGGN